MNSPIFTLLTILLLHLFLTSPEASATEAAPAPDALVSALKQRGFTLKASTTLKRDDHQNLFAAGSLESVFKHLQSLKQSTLYHFQKKEAEEGLDSNITFHCFEFDPPLESEAIKELASFESLTLERSLNRLKLAHYFIAIDDPKEASKNNSHTRSISYRLSKSDSKTSVEIHRIQHYATDHLYILNAIDCHFNSSELTKLLESSLPKAPATPPIK